MPSPIAIGDLEWDEKPGRPASPTRVYRVGPPKGAPQGPPLESPIAPHGEPWLTPAERDREAARLARQVFLQKRPRHRRA